MHVVGELRKVWRLGSLVVVGALAGLLLVQAPAFSHSGGTDKYGCHAGSRPYHCHGGGSGGSGGGVSGSGSGSGAAPFYDAEAARQRTVDARQAELDDAQSRLSAKEDELAAAERDQAERRQRVSDASSDAQALRDRAANLRRDRIDAASVANARIDAARDSHELALRVWPRHRQVSAWVFGALASLLPFLLLRRFLGVLTHGWFGVIGLGIAAIVSSVGAGAVGSIGLSLPGLVAGGILTGGWLVVLGLKWAAKFLTRWSVGVLGGLAIVVALTFVGALFGAGAPPEDLACQSGSSQTDASQTGEPEAQTQSETDPALSMPVVQAPSCEDEQLAQDAAQDPTAEKLPEAVDLEAQAAELREDLPALRAESEPLDGKVDELTAERDALRAEVEQDQAALDRAEAQ